MKKLHCAFTFVELIVVITIMAILATIGFSVYQSYLESSRDTNRVVQLSEISDGFEKLSLSARLPFPESMVEIQVGSGTVKTFAYQGFAGEKVMQAIGYVGGGQDPESSLYPSYMLSESRKDFQLMTFIKDAKLLSAKNLYANTQFEKLFPKVEGSPLGILLEQETQIPLQLLPQIQTTGIYNISTGTSSLIAYLADKKTLASTQGLTQLLPTSSCKRILELGRSNGNGIYTINPDGNGNISVYCDMTTDGGGWTMIARSVKNYTGPDTSFGWMVQRGKPGEYIEPYSLGSNVKRISFADVLISSYTGSSQVVHTWKLSQLNDENVENEITNYDSILQNSNIENAEFSGDYKVWGNIGGNITHYAFGNAGKWPYQGLYYDDFYSHNMTPIINGYPGMIFIR